MHQKTMDIYRQSSLSKHVVAFCRLLREQGVPVGTAEEADALRALTLVALADCETFRLTLRTVLARSQKEQQIFDALFSSYWEQGKTLQHLLTPPSPPPMGEVPSSRRVQRVRQIPTLLEWLSPHQGEEAEGLPAHSPLEVLSRKDFSTFTQDEFHVWVGSWFAPLDMGSFKVLMGSFKVL